MAANRPDTDVRIAELAERLRLPVFAAPMFLVSGPDLVIEACREGVIGAFPSLNARPLKALEEWLERISTTLAEDERQRPGKSAPWAVNLIVHRSNKRLDEDLDLTVRYQAPIVITSLGTPRLVRDEVHSYGGLLFCDVNSLFYARKAADAGADGLVLVAAGAGGHTGMITPFAFLAEVRKFFAGPLVLAGGISSGADVAAAIAMGADFAYIGTRFIAASESLAPDGYRQMLVDSGVDDLVLTPYFTGVPANYLKTSVERAGIDPAVLQTANPDIQFDDEEKRSRAWRDIWSAGQGVGSVQRVQSTAELVAELESGYRAAAARLARDAAGKIARPKHNGVAHPKPKK